MASEKTKSGENLNLYQKLAKIRKSLEVIKKDKAGYGYTYVSEAEILSKLSVQLDKMNLLLIPEIVPETTTTHLWDMEQTKKGEIEHKCEVVIDGTMNFTWINTDNPEERLVVPWHFAGQQSDASQAFGSGLTYCTRYFLLKFFNIATVEDDPDNWRGKQKQAEKEEDLLLAKGLVEQIDTAAKEFVAKSKDPEKAKESLLAVTKKYVKSGNYLKIEEPALATRLLADVKDLSKDTKESKAK